MPAEPDAANVIVTSKELALPATLEILFPVDTKIVLSWETATPVPSDTKEPDQTEYLDPPAEDLMTNFPAEREGTVTVAVPPD